MNGPSPDTTRCWAPSGGCCALVWHFDAGGKIDRGHNLSGDQRRTNAYVWANYAPSPIPDRLA
ncbi:hypothetical protein [Streptomyces sp. NPDC048603]|uniref:hypothetical protein n=1 Tax=Streptomyces sp. NPDC048603 TaxID=3365577 RepID=UPI00371118F4